MVRNILIAAFAAFVPAAGFAYYNTNGSFVVASVATYTETDSIYVSVTAPPAHAACNNSFFVIPGATPVERRKALLARLLVAKSTGETLNFGYDATGDCAEGYVRLHRVG